MSIKSKIMHWNSSIYFGLQKNYEDKNHNENNIDYHNSLVYVVV